MLQINEALADTLLTNLLKNAFVHNVQGGSIRITITRDSLTLANTGTPHPLDKRLIFTPFYHTPDSPSSTGLGLALVKAICQQCQLHLSYRFEFPYHCFEISR